MFPNRGPSDSEAPLISLDTTRTNGTEVCGTCETDYNPGAASSSRCPRAGSMLLETFDQRRYLVNTTCNTWRCLACRDRMKSKFKRKVATGCSRLGRCMFITITYKAGSKRLERADCVAMDWKALSRRLRKHQPWLAEMAWLRVMELTKAGTPHHHLVMGPVPEDRKIRCWGRNLEIVAYMDRFDSCECAAHCLAREWKAVTGDSWIVHTIAVTSAKGAGGYMAKYMGKEFNEERAAALGMVRRWSTSRSWPGSGRLRLLRTLGEGWRRAVYAPWSVESDIEGGDSDLRDREGDSLDQRLAEKSAAGRVLAKFGGFQDA